MLCVLWLVCIYFITSLAPRITHFSEDSSVVAMGETDSNLSKKMEGKRPRGSTVSSKYSWHCRPDGA